MYSGMPVSAPITNPYTDLLTCDAYTLKCVHTCMYKIIINNTIVYDDVDDPYVWFAVILIEGNESMIGSLSNHRR